MGAVEQLLANGGNQLNFDRRIARKGGNPDGRPTADSVMAQFTLQIGRRKVRQARMGGKAWLASDVYREAENSHNSFWWYCKHAGGSQGILRGKFDGGLVRFQRHVGTDWPHEYEHAIVSRRHA